MKNLLIAICLLTYANVCFADVYVNGYYRSNGTYVQPYHRSNPDGYIYNNYSNRNDRYNSYSSNNNTNTYTDYNKSYGNYDNYNANKARYGITPSTNLGFWLNWSRVISRV